MTAKKETQQNYDEMFDMITKISNPKERDVAYLEGVMETKKYHHSQKKKLSKMLDELREGIVEEEPVEETVEEPKSAVEFDKDSTVGKRRAAEKVAEEARALVDSAAGGEKKSKIKVVNMATKEVDEAIEAAPTDRTLLFTECQKELNELADKYLKLARKNKGSMSSRLTIVSRDLARHARNTLRL